MSVFGSPPFSVTPAIHALVADIVAGMMPFCWQEDSARQEPRQHLNRIRKIQASLAMEQFSLGVEEVADLLAGHRSAALPHEIREAKNAYAVYDSLTSFRASSLADLQAAHRCLTQGLLTDAGCLRCGGTGLARGRRILYLAPPADRVSALMRDLLEWLSWADVHPLIAGCVFHCELEFIHPFADGNGRMGRLWQTLVHSCWNPMFAFLPWEVILRGHQETFYQILAECDSVGNSTAGVEFLLHIVRQALRDEVESPARMSLISLQERIR